ncbi:REST corepressor 3-like isoform X2 [Varroa destructor]|uniref:REST corepressor n=1 Tax=Varroa destructor TaxID=109461 RepID=A0A7M7JL23_VARDE|nr:REST corepressor 3-like isoform X2 [Varroa destructor]
MVLAANGHHGDSSDDDRERENVIHIGSAYQATCPELISSGTPCPAGVPDKALLVWKPEAHISDSSLETYITLAKEKYGYNGEQALGMLYWHGYDVEKAIHDLPNFTPLPDEWTVEDKVLFEQAFQFHGKNFAKIRQMLPDKTIPSLVKYYYSWKKAKNRVSLMDRQARRLRHDEADDGGSGNATENESDSDEKDPACSHCGQSGGPQGGLVASPKGSLCAGCNQHWKKTGMLPKTGGLSKHIVGLGGALNGVTGADLKKQKKPPKGMHLNYQDLMAIAAGPPGQGDAILKGLDSELCSLKRQVQLNKADISKLREETSKGSVINWMMFSQSGRRSKAFLLGRIKNPKLSAMFPRSTRPQVLERSHEVLRQVSEVSAIIALTVEAAVLQGHLRLQRFRNSTELSTGINTTEAIDVEANKSMDTWDISSQLWRMKYITYPSKQPFCKHIIN